MEISAQWVLAWLAAVSLAAVAVTVWDKIRARRHAWRVPERTLWLVAALGGAAAMYATMCVVRHKTLHRVFMIGLPLLVLAQVGAVLALWYTDCVTFI